MEDCDEDSPEKIWGIPQSQNRLHDHRLAVAHAQEEERQRRIQQEKERPKTPRGMANSIFSLLPKHFSPPQFAC